MNVHDVDPQDEKFYPICPHCSVKLTDVGRVRDETGMLPGLKGSCYFCLNCKKVLGFADYRSESFLRS